MQTDGNGLYYMRARYYNPEIKRFINQDVLRGSITDSTSLNRYSYVNGNPISYIDPFGLSKEVAKQSGSESNWNTGAINEETAMHFLMDLFGIVPGIGDIADVVHGLTYLMEADIVNAVICFASIIPMLDISLKAVKYTVKILDDTGVLSKIARAAAKYVGRSADEIVDIARTGVKSGDIDSEAHNVVKYAKLKEQYRVIELANNVADSIVKTGGLPDNYITKSQAKAMGWSEGKALHNYAPGMAVGGDIFDNINGILPSSDGRIWREADIGIDYTMSRSNPKNPSYRILYSNDGLVYGTYDHYSSVFQILP